ncbi:PaaI family thioesterase [Cumulibacter manganitolerans]|uniref:PaaI family thioesterase n=1 Tax=Cumulibacter manganitolerans TaxID=1884992 RepID=UPI001295EEEA|nr:PaaI family thioesterase [Cumulibacter manganitolerans]
MSAIQDEIDEIDTPALHRPDVYDGLADAVRELLDATVRTRIAAAEVEALTARLRGVSRELLVDAHPGSLGRVRGADEWGGNPANPVDGRRNAFAQPLQIHRDYENQRAAARFSLGAPYEGPPEHIHGGVIAMLLDQVMGMVPAFTDTPRMTAYLNVTYRRPSPLMAELGVEAWVDRIEGRKTFVTGRIADADGRTTAEAEALFVALKPGG